MSDSVPGVRRAAPEIALFVVSAVALAVLCWRVSDWAVMTDELLYERLALSFVDGAFLPTLHGEHVDVYGVLYPFLLMPVFAVVDLPDAIRLSGRCDPTRRHRANLATVGR